MGAKIGGTAGEFGFVAYEIGRRFGTAIHLITRHAIRLNPPMDTENTRKVEGYARHRNPRQYFSENQKKYRSEWVKIVEEDGKLNRKELADKHNFIYLWLKRNASEWFESHLPPLFIAEREKKFILIGKKLMKNSQKSKKCMRRNSQGE